MHHARPSRRRGEARRDRLHLRTRHRHQGQRRHRGRRDPEGVRRAAAAHHLHQVDDRPHHGRGERAVRRRLRTGHHPPVHSAHDQPLRNRSRVRPRLRAQHGARGRAAGRAEQRPGVRREQRRADSRQIRRGWDGVSPPFSADSGRRWAVAGTGMVASIGATGGEVFDALCAGRSGLAPLRGFDPALFRAQHAYEIPEPTRAVGAARPLRGTAELWWTEAVPLDPADLHFGTALRTVFGAAATHTFSNACSASLYALGLGSDLLASGAADTVVVAGVDVITESMFALLDRVHPEPVDSVRPFDRNRKGVLMGDGAAAVVLRSADSGPAKAWLRGVGLNCDAYHVTAPDPAGMIAAMRQAHALSGVTPAEVDLVLAHGTGTLRNDEAEAFALAEAFAGLPISPLVTAVKSMTGHTSGSSGLMSLVVAVSCLATGMVPPTIGLVDPVEEADGLRFVTDGPVRSGPRLAQVDAFGFGGVNAVAVVERGE